MDCLNKDKKEVKQNHRHINQKPAAILPSSVSREGPLLYIAQCMHVDIYEMYYNMGKRDLPDTYAKTPEGCRAAPRVDT